MKQRFSFLVVTLFLLSVILMACTTSTATASCAFVVGDGIGNDADLREVIYPGQQVYINTDEVVSYVPCNSRNYIINDGTVKNANGETVGDRDRLVIAYTKTGVPITIAVRALWTLNQSEAAMQEFYKVCFKYQCASTEDIGGDINFATAGWNGMLAENFGTTLDTVARMAASEIDDTIWSMHDPKQYQALADKMSAYFADVMRANLGYSVDLFCGSGNSTWSDPDNPGTGSFTCTPVRIVVDDVQRGEIQEDESTEGLQDIYEQRLNNAKALYGSGAEYWLGLMDAIEKCKSAGSVTCIFNIGNADDPTFIPQQ